jgi:hypothetical protein
MFGAIIPRFTRFFPCTQPFYPLQTSKKRKSMNLVTIIVDCIFILASICYVLIPFCDKRNRALWAKVIFITSGLLGISSHIVKITLDIGWFAVSKHTFHNFYMVFRVVDVLLLVLIFVLIITGQLLGAKRT